MPLASTPFPCDKASEGTIPQNFWSSNIQNIQNLRNVQTKIAHRLAFPPLIFGSSGGANRSALQSQDTVACCQLLVAEVGASNSNSSIRRVSDPLMTSWIHDDSWANFEWKTLEGYSATGFDAWDGVASGCFSLIRHGFSISSSKSMILKPLTKTKSRIRTLQDFPKEKVCLHCLVF